MGSLILGSTVLLLPALVAVAACAIAGFLMLDRVERGGTGALLGVFLGPIGLAIAWVIRDNALRDVAEREERRRRSDATAAVPRGLRSPGPIAIDELERLAALKERGHITADEFDRRKAALLAGQTPASQRRFR